MAEAQKFDNKLLCSMCLDKDRNVFSNGRATVDKYTKSKTLPCHHSFCFECIQTLPVKMMKNNKHYIRCPICSVDHILPQGGVANLPNAFQINSLLDLQKSLKGTSSKIPKQSKQKAVSLATTCSKHGDPLKVYCETCCQAICCECTISKEEHSTHNFSLISECYPQHHKQIQDCLEQVKHKMDALNTATATLSIGESEIQQKGQQLKEQIDAHTQRIIDQAQKSCAQLSQQVDTIVQQKTQVLTTQKQQAQKLCTQLEICQDMIEHNLKEWTKLQILTEKCTMMDKMNMASQHVDPAVFQPIEKTDMQFTITNGDVIQEEIGVITSTAYEKATLTFSPCQPNQQSTATLILQSHNGSPFSLSPSLISSTLFSPSTDSEKHVAVTCNMTQIYPGEYNITFTPSSRHDQLIVQVGGVDVPDSPFTPPVIPSLDTRGKPVNIITGLNEPYSTAVCDNGDIVVAEHGAHCITILNSRGKKVKSFGTNGTKEGQFTCPRGVAIAKDGDILVTDDHRLQKLTTDGVCVKSVGSSNSTGGKDQLQFSYSRGIAVHPTTGQIFVADYQNNCIQVFTHDLFFVRSITLHDPFNGPHDVTFDEKGYLYVTESSNDCITKLTLNELCIARFSSQGSSTPSCPTSLTIHNNLVYVTELGNCRVSIFDTKGTLLRCFGLKEIGEEEFSGPVGITTDTIGNLYISDVSNNRIIVC